ncbi:MAG: hypothetical protein Q9163_000464 [Psora crenata]
MEDDADWDLSLKDRLVDFSRGSRHFTAQPSGGANPRSPYGDNWDILWLGHCSITQCPASDPHTSPDHATSPLQQQRYLVENDPTVPLPAKRLNFASTPDLSAYGNMTRAVFRADYGICLYAYALSYSGAQKVLRAQAVRQKWAPIDLGIAEMCQDTANPTNCIGVFPQLFDSHKMAGSFDRDSNIGTFSHDDVREHAYTPNIVHSIRLNLDRLLKGEKPLSQWPEDPEPVPEPGGVRHRIVDVEIGKSPNIMPEGAVFT